MPNFVLSVNGKPRTVDVDPSTPYFGYYVITSNSWEQNTAAALLSVAHVRYTSTV